MPDMSTTDERDTLGSTLFELREEKAMTLQELTDQTGIDVSTIHKYEGDLRSISRDAYEALVLALEPTKKERLKLDLLYRRATKKHPACSDLQAILPRALRDEEIVPSDILKVTKVGVKSRRGRKYKLQLKDGTSRQIMVSVNTID
jgi:transcriptional regulator with XRE-family HTH domain